MIAHRDIEVRSLAICVGQAKFRPGEGNAVVGKHGEQSGGGRVGKSKQRVAEVGLKAVL